MEYAKSVSSAKFYIVLYGSIFSIVLGFKAIQNRIALEQATRIVTLALSIILQALPFILIGVLASSIIRVFVKEEWITRFAPNSGIAGVIVGA